MNESLISVIVPIYNVQKYLDRCVNSILNQTFSKFELILVDDGSPDKCPQMCDSYSKIDKRIKVIHKSNGGLSDARNAGLKVAQGEFIVFIDSDDYIHPKYLEILYEVQSETNSDLVICGYDVTNSDLLGIQDQKAERNYIILNKSDSIDRIYSDIPYESLVMIVAWNKLYKRKIFDNIEFPFGKVSEDNYIIVDLLEQCETIAVCSEKLYYYFFSDNSITRSNYSKKNFDLLDALKERTPKLKKYGHSIYKKHINYYIKQIYIDYYRTQNKKLKKELKKRFKEEFRLQLREGNIFYNSSIIKYFLFIICPSLSHLFVKFVSTLK